MGSEAPTYIMDNKCAHHQESSGKLSALSGMEAAVISFRTLETVMCIFYEGHCGTK